MENNQQDQSLTKKLSLITITFPEKSFSKSRNTRRKNVAQVLKNFSSGATSEQQMQEWG